LTIAAEAPGSLPRPSLESLHMPHLLYLAIGFPPAAKSCAYRMRATANLFCSLGWRVTVLTLPVQAWELEFGVDQTLMDGVDPRVRVVEMPLAREDLDPEVRNYSWLRARYPDRWRNWRHRRDMVAFPEKVFGSWRRTIVRTALAVHAECPVDLALITPAPYTALAAARPLHQRGVPFVVDYRDGWSLDVINGVEAFGRGSRRGRIEQKVMADATRVWCVNEPIAEFYRQRYSASTERIRVVRNGFDASDHLSQPPRPRDHGEPLHFGYLGTINFPVAPGGGRRASANHCLTKPA
jgi:glycosyltransferase involved in cell wall biosynthesis